MGCAKSGVSERIIRSLIRAVPYYMDASMVRVD